MKSAAFAALLCFAIPAAGQPSAASVGGIVTDQSAAPLSDATVTIAHVRNGRVLTVTTGREGEYRAVALIPGEYDLTAERSGFTAVARRVTLFVGADATVSFTLRVAGVDVQTTVVAEVPLVEAARFQPTSTVTQRQIDTLPVLERNFLVLAQLLPGSGPINSTVSRFAVTKFGGVADQRSGYTTLVDGGDVDDAQWGSPTINVGQDAVQEFTVFRNQFDVQYGHALNAVVAIATRSGTNRFSGTGFYFGRDEALNARNPFAQDKPPFDEHRLGGTFGGPVIRGRTHFFGAYERDTVNNSRIIALPPANVLAATENGVFPAKSHDALSTLRLDDLLNTQHALSIRYNHENQQSLRSAAAVTSDTSQVDTFNRSHSLVVEETWTPTQNAANAVRVHLLAHTLGTSARNTMTAVSRPAGNIGQANRDSQVVPRTKLAVSDTFYFHAARHEIKFGGEFAFATHDLDAHVLQYGLFQFRTDEPFDEHVPSTWPFAFQQQKPTVFTYRSQELAGFFQDDWRIGERFWMNAGVRYDIDLNLRLNDFYARMLNDPSMVALDTFITRDRGTDTNNVQPRLGATWDARGDGRMIIRAGSGLYVTRNRPWYQLRSMNQFGSSVVRITDPALLRNYPDITAVLGGRTLDSFIAAGGPRQLGTVIPDDFVQPYAVNTTAGVGWQLTKTAALDVDYVHSYANHQIGSTDRNLPPSGAVSPANPRPVPQFAQVVMLENFTKSSYDALETQFRGHLGTRDSFQLSYTLSRSYLDGVDFFLTTRGTQRTPHERGYNPTDQRHNLAVAGSMTMPWDLQVSGILELVSGSPIKVQAGLDLDLDQTLTGDLPPGIPITVGRERVNESLLAINTFRATQGLAPVDRSLLLLDPYRSLDARLTKTIRIGDNRRIELLVEGFNLTNHVNFRPPLGSQPQDGVSLNTASALVRTAARDARQIQWALRYAF
jgi:carboxypeptidase family protein